MSNDHVTRFRAHGYAVVRGLFDAEEVAALAAAFDAMHAQALARGRSWRHRNTLFRLASDDRLGTIVRFVQWPGWHDETLERFRRDDRIFSVLEPLLGRDLKQIINQMHWKTPGAATTEFGFHQDSRSRRPRSAYRDLANSYIQTGIAIDPHRADNGAMIVCEGSHRLGELPFDPEQPSMYEAMDLASLKALGVDAAAATVLEMEPGDLALWHVHTLHGSGPNYSSIDRRFYINGYVAAANCDRGEWAFRDGKPCPLRGEPALVHYEQLFEQPGPMYVD